DDAKANAKSRLDEAEKRAKELVSDAEQRASKLLGDAEQRLVEIRLERESVAGYIQSLRGVLASAEKLAEDHGFPAGVPDDEPPAAGTDDADEADDADAGEIDEDTR